MKTPEKEEPINLRKPLRLCPGIILAVLLLLIRYLIPVFIPNSAIVSIFGGLLLSLAIVIWWTFFSRASPADRLGGLVIMALALTGASFLLHESIATANMGMMFLMFALPALCLAFVAGILVTQRFPIKMRRIAMTALIIISSGFWTLLRTDGLRGEARHDLAWRWSETAEEKLLKGNSDTGEARADALTEQKFEPEWPGFRGTNRNGICPDLQIETDWVNNPPEEIWRKPVGPGCSSFAIAGDYCYTYEQRGEYEVVSCYHLLTGEPVWQHSDSARFWDSHAGAGPRSTPTLSGNKLYTLGATGIFNAFDSGSGRMIWSRNAATDASKEIPGWGFTSSPLVIDTMVFIALAGKLAAYDSNTGNPVWFGPDGGGSYSSPHLLAIEGIKQVVLMSQAGATAFLPADGTILWQHSCPQEHIVQPSVIGNNDLLISAGLETGMRRITVSRKNTQWNIEERWTSPRMKTNFNDFVIHKGYAYGFHGPLLACISLDNGELKWKGGRYSGQLILLPDQNLLIVLTEKGEIALVNAIPGGFSELTRIKALKGKTWNHPALANDLLLVRNAEEMVAYRLSWIK